ncbi:MAG: ABC transporter permease [Clostridiales bacterium]|nr:ABC transporter permease [Clostridiales bacterium]
MSLHRIIALFMRHIYLYRRSLPRLMEIFYWPFLDLLLWGFISLYLVRYRENLPNFVAFLLGALILWDILFRSQQGISVSFLEDIWARNFLNIFASPLKPLEYVVSLMLVSSVKIIIAGTIMSLLAWLLYSFNIFLLGISLLPFILSLVILGWAIGIITISLILRFGQQAEVLAWGLALLFQPVSAVFYPVSVLPPALQAIARFIPASYVFEGMRGIIHTGSFPHHELIQSFALDTAYIGVAFLFFCLVMKTVKKRGLLAKIGE